MGRDLNRRMDMKRAWCQVLDKGVLDSVYHFKEVSFDGVGNIAGTRLLVSKYMHTP